MQDIGQRMKDIVCGLQILQFKIHQFFCLNNRAEKLKN